MYTLVGIDKCFGSKDQASKYGKVSIDKYWQITMYRKVFRQLSINIYRQVVQRRREKLKPVQNGQVYDRTDTYKIVQPRVKTTIQNRIYVHFNTKKRRKKKGKN